MDLPRSFADIGGREWALETDEAQELLRGLPRPIGEALSQYYLHPSPRGTQEVVDYFIAHSSVFDLVQRTPGTALALEYLYTRQATKPIDEYFIKCKAGSQIYQRLLALEANLPCWLTRLLDAKRAILVDNIGAGTGRDMIGVLSRNKHFIGTVHVRNIDPDTESLAISQRLAQDNGISGSFSFEASRFSDAPSANADLVLMIGVLCPLKGRSSRIVLRNAGRCTGGAGNGYLQHSFAQHGYPRPADRCPHESRGLAHELQVRRRGCGSCGGAGLAGAR